MKRTLTAAAAALIALSAAAGAVSAQPYDHDRDHGRYDDSYRHGDNHRNGDNSRYGDNNRYNGHDNGRHNGWVRHDEWRPGHRIDRAYWDRGSRVDWRSRHLRQPPRGYEWREVDGNYVLAAAATGLIATIIANSR